jgi:hypothetical protein
MKKFLMIGSLCLVLVLFTGSAFADITFPGRCTVSYIKMYESDSLDVPVKPCEVTVHFFYGLQDWELDVTATGTQLNLGLLKAWNEQLNISCTLILRTFSPFVVWIADIDFDTHPTPPPPGG